mmetsp:Transcript_1221/g.1950  ORF Transcript_1221/g.1950 Transcript_1221/m.1950 type:complete len:346 (+) Transcript_1221:119-1156(+)
MVKLTCGFLQISPSKTLVFFTFVNLLVYMDVGAVSGVVPHIKEDLNLSSIQTGLLGSVFTLGFMASSPVFGHQAQHVHPYSLMAIGLSVYLVSLVTAGLSSNYYLLLTARAFTGVGEASFISLASPCILDKAPSDKKSLWLSISSSPLGAPFGVVFGAGTSKALGWRWTFLIQAALMAPFVVIAAISFKEPELVARRDEGSTRFKAQVVSLLKTPVLVFLSLGCSAVTFTASGFGFWSVYYLNHYYGLPTDQAGYITGVVIVICGFGGVILGSAFLDKKLKSQVRQHEQGNISDSELQSARVDKSASFVAIVISISCLFGVVGSSIFNVYVYVVCLGASLFFLYT